VVDVREPGFGVPAHVVLVGCDGHLHTPVHYGFPALIRQTIAGADHLHPHREHHVRCFIRGGVVAGAEDRSHEDAACLRLLCFTSHLQVIVHLRVEPQRAAAVRPFVFAPCGDLRPRLPPSREGSSLIPRGLCAGWLLPSWGGGDDRVLQP